MHVKRFSKSQNFDLPTNISDIPKKIVYFEEIYNFAHDHCFIGVISFIYYLRGGSTLQRENRAYFSEMNCKGSTKDINTNFFFI